jgi:hypothetical protein
MISKFCHKVYLYIWCLINHKRIERMKDKIAKDALETAIRGYYTC